MTNELVKTQYKNTSGSGIFIKRLPAVKLGNLKLSLPDWTFVRPEGDTQIVLENPNGYKLPIEYVEYKNEAYLKIGNSTYLVVGDQRERTAVDLEAVNAIGNYLWFKFFNRKYSQILHNTDFHLPFDDSKPGEVLRLYPLNWVLYPSLKPQMILPDVLAGIRQKLLRIFGRKGLKSIAEDDLKRIKYNFCRLINYLAIVAVNGDSQDYYDAQNALTALEQWVSDGVLRGITPFDLPKTKVVENTELLKLILHLKEFVLLCRTGANWQKWKRLKQMLTPSSRDQIESSQGTQRTKTIYERRVTPARLQVPSELLIENSRNGAAESWRVVDVEALGRNDLEPLASKVDVQKADQVDGKFESTSFQRSNGANSVQDYQKLKQRAAIFGFGETLIGNAIMASLAFAGGSATTVKKILGKNKLVHLALKVNTPNNRAKWISLLHARAGMMLGQNPNSKIVFITNVEGPISGRKRVQYPRIPAERVHMRTIRRSNS